MLRKHPKIFQDPHIDYPIYDFDLSFSDYIAQSKTIIANTRQDLANHPELTIENNAPFELKPPHSQPKCGALLIHGLLDSPFIMRDIGHYLQSENVLVRGIMLPGHSTVPGALLNTTYDEWLQALKYGVATLKKEVEKIFLVGFSTGANLAICHALQDPAITGLILLAPALKINSAFTFLSKWICAANKKWQRAQWFSICEEIDYLKYQSVTFNAIYQVYQLGLNIQKIGLDKLSMASFMILSQEDKIICSKTDIKHFQKTTLPANRALLYSEKPLTFADKRIVVRDSIYPHLNIFNFCHISLPVAPNNFHYGQNGDYPLASHPKKDIKYGAIDNLEALFYKKLYQFKLTPFRYERLTYNPDFEFMQQQMREFIKQTITSTSEL